MVDAIARAQVRHGFHLWAFVIMPEHVHLLIVPMPADSEVGLIVKSIKQSVTRRALLALKDKGREAPGSMIDVRPNGQRIVRFWQRGGGHDRNLWNPKHIHEAIDYIHMNPVQRGLCKKPTAWEWSSARALAGNPQPLRIDFEHVPPIVVSHTDRGTRIT